LGPGVKYIIRLCIARREIILPESPGTNQAGGETTCRSAANIDIHIIADHHYLMRWSSQIEKRPVNKFQTGFTDIRGRSLCGNVHTNPTSFCWMVARLFMVVFDRNRKGMSLSTSQLMASAAPAFGSESLWTTPSSSISKPFIVVKVTV
jgi:hypothetical protein